MHFVLRLDGCPEAALVRCVRPYQWPHTTCVCMCVCMAATPPARSWLIDDGLRATGMMAVVPSHHRHPVLPPRLVWPCRAWPDNNAGAPAYLSSPAPLPMQGRVSGRSGESAARPPASAAAPPWPAAPSPSPATVRTHARRPFSTSPSPPDRGVSAKLKTPDRVFFLAVILSAADRNSEIMHARCPPGSRIFSRFWIDI